MKSNSCRFVAFWSCYRKKPKLVSFSDKQIASAKRKNCDRFNSIPLLCFDIVHKTRKIDFFHKSIECMLYCCPFESRIVFISFYGLFYFTLRCVSPTTPMVFSSLFSEICPILGLNLVWITFHSLANFYFNSRMTHRTKFRKWNI